MEVIEEKEVGKTFQVLQALGIFRQYDYGAGDIGRSRWLDRRALGFGKGGMYNAYGLEDYFRHNILNRSS